MVLKRIWNRLLVNFINGIVILLPITVTTALISFIFVKLNKIVLNPIMNLFAPAMRGPEHVYAVKVLIFWVVIFTVALIGYAAKNLFIHRAFSLGEKLLIKIPIMGRIYNAFKQIFSAFIGQGKTIFKQVVLVEYPRNGLYSLGFTTGITKGAIREHLGESAVNVFIPTTPNPTSGMFIVIPRNDVHFLDMSVEDGMKLVVSGGSVSPAHGGDAENEDR
ncbi:MAG: DUF502 domain-containing protein [Candidatus Omnitrophota bacterium]